jgi:O-methyltransferase involved in polyketide biosynthesis
MSDGAGDLSVTALYTSAAWSWGDLPNAHLFDHAQARRVFRVVNAVLGVTRPFTGSRGPLPVALLHRHTFIDALLRVERARRVLELAAGLSRRGVTFSADPLVEYVEVDRPDVVAAKRRLLERSAQGRAALGRPNFRLVAADVQSTSLDELAPRDGSELFVIAEGLLMYLEADAQRALARDVAARLRDGGGAFVFDFVPPREQPLPGRVGRGLGWAMKRMTGGRGFAEDERTRAEVTEDLLRRGFDRVEAVEPRVVAREWGLPHPDAETQQLVFVAHVDRPPSRGTS